MTTGEKIYELRKKANLTQEELAEKVGVSRQAVSKWENGEAYPETEKLLELCKLFGVSADELLLGTSGATEKESPARTIPLHYEYVSKTTLFGLPLVHINFGLGHYRAKGIIAIGNVATGFLSLGFVSFGLLSFGLLAIGLLAFATLALSACASFGAVAVSGLVSFGGVAVGGLISFGGVAVGNVAIGGAAFGNYAVGGYANGKIAIGNTTAVGEHAFVVPQQLEELLLYLNESVKGWLRDFLETLAKAIG